jgi:hypothetical protein
LLISRLWCQGLADLAVVPVALDDLAVVPVALADLAVVLVALDDLAVPDLLISWWFLLLLMISRCRTC